MNRLPKMRRHGIFDGEERPMVVKQKAESTNNGCLPIGPHFSLERLIAAVRPLNRPSATIERVHGAPPGAGNPKMNPSDKPALDVDLQSPDGVLAVEVID